MRRHLQRKYDAAFEISQKSLAEIQITLHQLYRITILRCPLIWNKLSEHFLPHQESSRQSGILELFIRWIIFCKLQNVPLIKFKFYDGRHQPLKRAFDSFAKQNRH